MLSYHLAATFPASKKKTASNATSTGHSRVLQLIHAYLVLRGFAAESVNEKLSVEFKKLTQLQQ